MSLALERVDGFYTQHVVHFPQRQASSPTVVSIFATLGLRIRAVTKQFQSSGSEVGYREQSHYEEIHVASRGSCLHVQ